MTELAVGITLGTVVSSGGGDVPGSARHVEDLGLESVWAPDLLSGDGTPSLECMVTLAAAAAVTQRVGIGFGVLALPSRPVPLTATQVATLQHISRHRVLLGVGSGGFFFTPFWQAMGVPGSERGSRTDAALDVLSNLIAGVPTRLDGGPDQADQPVVTLAPGVAAPPILVAGNSDVAIRRAAKYGDGWFPSLILPEALAEGAAKLEELAAAQGRPIPGTTVGGHAVVGRGDEARSSHEAQVRSLVDFHGMSADEAEKVPMTAATTAELAERFAAYQAAGAARIVISPGGSNWHHQCELIAEAHALLS
jgi:alkanesulfonate monooxygenase SsuD/methylene tetrahydromethanopterin reductase-like flavin-dependent oxidoreductase (luciferase family)